MATAIPKITLSSSRDIPFNRLVLSQSNVRRVKSGLSIEELARDIERRGLLQSLNVRPVLDGEGAETGTYEVPAGGRRFRALELLVKQKKLAKTASVPCVVREAGSAIHAEEDSLAVRSDLSIENQVTARGATWLDRQAVARDPVVLGQVGFGGEVRDAMERRAEQLIEQGFAERRAQGIVLARNLIAKLRGRELHEAGERLASETGRTFSQSASGEYVTGTYRQRMVLASGRYAMIDDGLQFQLVPWTPSLERQQGRHVSGVARDDGGIDWSFTRNRGLGL